MHDDVADAAAADVVVAVDMVEEASIRNSFVSMPHSANLPTLPGRYLSVC